MQIVGLVLAVILTAIYVDEGGGMGGGFTLFIKSLPVCAVGIVIYKVFAKQEFQKPTSWPEWIAAYVLGMLIGGPLFGLVVVLYKQVFR